MLRESIFISYSHKDIKWLNEVKKRLSILEHNYNLVVWDDRSIKPGSNWRDEIEQSIQGCRVAVLLVSNNFLASEFILKKELPGILKRAKQEGVIIFNVILDACAFRLTELETFQCLNNPDQPVEELRKPERNRVLVNLTNELLAAVKQPKNNLPGEYDKTLSEENIYLPLILVLTDLVKNGAKPITEIENITKLKRKLVVSALEKLQAQRHIEKYKGIYEKKPSTLWKASESGVHIFNLFENAYNKIISSKG